MSEPSPLFHSGAVLDDALQAGPSTSWLGVEADPSGGVFYQLAANRPRIFQLAEEFGLRRLVVLDSPRAVWFLEPGTHRLAAGACFPSCLTRVILFGEFWGQWIDEMGCRRTSSDPFANLARSRLPGMADPKRGELSFEFHLNIHNREIFTEDARRGFDPNPNVSHQAELTFRVPSGDYRGCKILLLDRRKGTAGWAIGVQGFPLRFPSGNGATQGVSGPARPASPPPPRPEPRESPVPPRMEEPPAEPGRVRLRPKSETPPEVPPPPRPASPPEEDSGRIRLRPRPAAEPESPPPPRNETPPEARPEPAPAPAEPAAPPRVKKGHLTGEAARMDLAELLEALDESAAEPDAAWRLIEPNLIAGRAERIYPLIGRWAELIAERTSAWPPARLKMIFGHLPGGLLLPVMAPWRVNQVMIVAENAPESETILDWLKEREVERLFRIDTSREPVTADAARRALNVDRSADEAMIKKVWRTLLHCIHADLGRREERAIHRRKDEIAKHLQTARNVLLKTLEP